VQTGFAAGGFGDVVGGGAAGARVVVLGVVDAEVGAVTVAMVGGAEVGGEVVAVVAATGRPALARAAWPGRAWARKPDRMPVAATVAAITTLVILRRRLTASSRS
jgi:hypothetical protein